MSIDEASAQGNCDDALSQLSSKSSLISIFQKAVALIETAPEQSTATLSHLQIEIARQRLFSKNESLDDVQTTLLPLLSVEYYLAVSILTARGSPTAGLISAHQRRANVIRSIELFHDYLRRVDCVGLFDSSEAAESSIVIKKDYYRLLQSEDKEQEDGGDCGELLDAGKNSNFRPLHAESRDVKVARYRQKKELEGAIVRYNAVLKRMERLGLSPEDEIDGISQGEMYRYASLTELTHCSVKAIEEIVQCKLEINMLAMAVEQEIRRTDTERRLESSHYDHGNSDLNLGRSPARDQPKSKRIQVTKVTKDALSGKLMFQREEIKSQVFRPGWNQPTMTLDQLAEMEVQDAINRSDRQRAADNISKHMPRRYEQLVRDGMEDNANLVDASADLDRKWDDFKDANPRGCGNKMSDRGDRNI